MKFISQNQNYLIPSDNLEIDYNELFRYAINTQHTLNSFNTRKPFAIIFILDCCRSYHPSRNKNLDKPIFRSTVTKTLEDPMATPRDESLIIFACSDGALAADGRLNENGLFTKHLLKHIETPNKHVMMMLSNVIKGVKNESNSQQIPKIYSSLTHEHVYLNEKRLGKF